MALELGLGLGVRIDSFLDEKCLEEGVMEDIPVTVTEEVDDNSKVPEASMTTSVALNKEFVRVNVTEGNTVTVPMTMDPDEMLMEPEGENTGEVQEPLIQSKPCGLTRTEPPQENDDGEGNEEGDGEGSEEEPRLGDREDIGLGVVMRVGVGVRGDGAGLGSGVGEGL